jgi:hypothetical protein
MFSAEGEHNDRRYDVDGTSIPQMFWWVIGSPYTGDYRRAAVLHDAAYFKKVDAKESPRNSEKIVRSEAAVTHDQQNLRACRGIVLRTC